jgi:Trk-type K+ transport system membrane component
MLVTGLLVATLGVAMLLPALVDLAADNKDWMIFASSGTMTTLVGLGLFAANRGIPKGLSTRQAMLMTVVVWVALVAFGRAAISLVGDHAELHRRVFRIDVGTDHHRRHGHHRPR